MQSVYRGPSEVDHPADAMLVLHKVAWDSGFAPRLIGCGVLSRQL